MTTNDATPISHPRDSKENPFRPEFLSGNTWSSNALRFPDNESAVEYARDLFDRWTHPTGWRVVNTTELAVTEKY